MAEELQFSVVKSKISWGTYFRDLMKPRFGGAAGQSSGVGFESYSGRNPSVVAKNSRGETRVIAVVQKPQEAKDQAAVIERDFKSLARDVWCERYGVPLDFISG